MLVQPEFGNSDLGFGSLHEGPPGTDNSSRDSQAQNELLHQMLSPCSAKGIPPHVSWPTET